MKMNFKEWLKLQEMGTSTSGVAVFSRPVIFSRRGSFEDLYLGGREQLTQKKKKSKENNGLGDLP